MIRSGRSRRVASNRCWIVTAFRPGIVFRASKRTLFFDRQITLSVATSNGLSDQRNVPAGTSKIDELTRRIALRNAKLDTSNSKVTALAQALSNLPKPLKILTGH